MRLFESARQLYLVLSRSERVVLRKVLLCYVLLGFVEAAGIISIWPFLAVLENSELIESDERFKVIFFYWSSVFDSGHSQFVFFLGVLSCLVLVLSTVTRAWCQHIFNRNTETCRSMLSTRLFSEYLSKPYVFFLDRNTSELGKNLLSEVDHLVDKAIRPAILMLSTFFVLISLLSLIAFLNPVIFFLTVIFFGCTYSLIFSCMRRPLVGLGSSLQRANSSRFFVVHDAFADVKSKKIFQSELVAIENFENLSSQYTKANYLSQTLAQLPAYLIEILIILAAVFIGLLSLDMDSKAGGAPQGITSFLGLSVLFAYRLKPLFQAQFKGLAALKFSEKMIGNINAELGQRVAFDEAGDIGCFSFDRLELQGIRFAYPGGSGRLIISDVSLTVEKNSAIALVGSTGSGKTTLVDLLVGLLEPTGGCISVNGQKCASLSSFYNVKLFSYVPQNVTLSDQSLLANICGTTNLSDIDLCRLRECVRLALVDEFVSFEDILDPAFMVGERGGRLSGGQRQRVGIARAIFFGGAILILDEATSALDKATERKLIQRILNSQMVETLLVISHSLKSLEQFSVIYVLEKGRIKASGSYDWLLSESTEFKRLLV